MVARGFIFIRLCFFTIICGIFFTIPAYAQETKPVYRAFYPHQITEAVANEEILSGAVKNGFITYHKEGGGIAKISLPKGIKTSDDFRVRR